MTAVTGRGMELLYSMPTAGAALASSSTKTLISANASGNPAAQLPSIATLWPDNSKWGGAAYHVVLAGTFATASTAGTLILAYALDATQGTEGTDVAKSGAIATTVLGGNTQTNMAFWGEFDLVLSTGTNAAGTTINSYCVGQVVFGTGNNAATATITGQVMLGSAAAIALNPATSYFWELYATWGNTNANSVQLFIHKIYGEN